MTKLYPASLLAYEELRSFFHHNHMVKGKRVAAIRIGTEKYDPIVKDLEKAGYAVLSVGKWPSV